jgi:hypothetical protein
MKIIIFGGKIVMGDGQENQVHFKLQIKTPMVAGFTILPYVTVISPTVVAS